MGGRKPIPASLIDPAEHKKSYDEIEVRQQIEMRLQTKADLRCPGFVSKEAKKEWRRVMKLYKGMDAQILNDLDQMALVMYCEATAVYKKAQETWQKYDQVISSDLDEQIELDKCFKLMERQTKIISSLSEQLCLTPVGRARMGMNAAKNNEPSRLALLLGDDD